MLNSYVISPHAQPDVALTALTTLGILGTLTTLAIFATAVNCCHLCHPLSCNSRNLRFAYHPTNPRHPLLPSPSSPPLQLSPSFPSWSRLRVVPLPLSPSGETINKSRDSRPGTPMLFAQFSFTSCTTDKRKRDYS